MNVEDRSLIGNYQYTLGYSVNLDEFEWRSEQQRSINLDIEVLDCFVTSFEMGENELQSSVIELGF